MEHQENPNFDIPDEIQDYYKLGLEAGRLPGGADGVLEFARTQQIINRYLPDPPAVILDVGGGPGAYALWLARQGYQVHLVDPVFLHLEQARQASDAQPEAPVLSFTLGDARVLDWPDESAEAVLLLGPLYHLTERTDRITALREAHRALKPGGRVFAAGISRFASALAGLFMGYLDDPDFARIVQRDLAEGQHRNPTGIASYFTTAFFHHPVELAQEMKEAGFTVEGVLAIEGVAVLLPDLAQQWQDPRRRERILEALHWLEAEPSMLGVTSHLMALGLKP